MPINKLDLDDLSIKFDISLFEYKEILDKLNNDFNIKKSIKKKLITQDEFNKYLLDKSNIIDELINNDEKKFDFLKNISTLILKYGEDNSVDTVTIFDDMKIIYFIGYIIWKNDSTENNILRNLILYISLVLLKDRVFPSNNLMVEKLQNTLLNKDINITDYYGIIGIYKILKTIYFERIYNESCK